MGKLSESSLTTGFLDLQPPQLVRNPVGSQRGRGVQSSDVKSASVNDAYILVRGNKHRRDDETMLLSQLPNHGHEG